jgi:hypothetical protein
VTLEGAASCEQEATLSEQEDAFSRLKGASCRLKDAFTRLEVAVSRLQAPASSGRGRARGAQSAPHDLYFEQADMMAQIGRHSGGHRDGVDAPSRHDAVSSGALGRVESLVEHAGRIVALVQLGAADAQGDVAVFSRAKTIRGATA